jgi:hypothetical protein
LCRGFNCTKVLTMKPRAVRRIRLSTATGDFRNRRPFCLLAALAALTVTPLTRGSETSAVSQFRKEIEPILVSYCYDCHGDGLARGNVAFDELKTDEALVDHELWLKVLKNVRANIMPPEKKARPNDNERERLEHWIKVSAFGLDLQNPDPGRVTVRRLNRVEYRNTVRDLTGVDFRVELEFPPDDSGHGFDNIADVLTLPPMLLEKYFEAAKSIVARSVPDAPGGRNYERFFGKAPAATVEARREHAREVLENFARRAFRRPVDDKTLDRLTALAESIYSQPGKTYEAGVSQAMVAVLASPRFLFREEGTEPIRRPNEHPQVDEYALASRLSYFLWSTMPDEELFRLAAEGSLRKNLSAQVKRMLADRRSEALVRNFVGQWLHTRDIENIPIEERAVLAREDGSNTDRERNRRRFRELRDKPEESLTPEEKEELGRLRAAFRNAGQPRVEMTGELRRAMRQETEKTFEYILREDRSLLELLDSDYTFLNERLARHYGIEDVTGNEVRRVTLPADSPRGGVLGQGTILAVTSNPTRTSPVKRGVFILENILGLPPPPPPPDIPPLEDAARKTDGRTPTLREVLAVHREQPLCSSCHNRMDPLGLAFENFNAMGMWRDQEYGQPIDAAGKLVTGATFSDVRGLKRILVTQHQRDFYTALTEKLMTYALGRGMEYYDVETVDQIVARLAKADGRPSALLMGIVESAPFQKTRNLNAPRTAQPTGSVRQRAEARTTP